MASAKDIVPHRSSAVHHASGAAGTTVRGRPAGIWPPWRCMKYSRLDAFGYGPTPETCHVSPVRARCTRIGATPATLTMSGWTTPSVNPPATPGIDGVASRAQHAGGGLGGERVAGGHGPASADRLDGRGRTVEGRADLGGRGV